ncbi:hypothetical protein Bca101_036619 [Brassica carinata]
MGMLVAKRRWRPDYGGTPNGYGGYAGGDGLMVLVKEEELEVEPWRWIKSRKVWRGDGGANGVSEVYGGGYESCGGR